MGNWFSFFAKDNPSLANRTITTSIDVLKLMKDKSDNSDIFNASLHYLQCENILKDTNDIFIEFNICKVYLGFKQISECCYLEALIISKNNDKRILNFWPSDEHTSIGISHATTVDTIPFEAHDRTDYIITLN